MIFEDAHWADALTLEALEVVGRRIEGTESLLVVTYRDDEPAEGARALAGGLDSAVRLQLSRAERRVAVEPLAARRRPGRQAALRRYGRESVPRDGVDRVAGRTCPRNRSETRRWRERRILSAEARGSWMSSRSTARACRLQRSVDSSSDLTPGVAECLAAGVIVAATASDSPTVTT